MERAIDGSEGFVRMIFAGIDPGKTGALAILYGDNSVEFFDVPR
jgi:hypothetical protein